MLTESNILSIAHKVQADECKKRFFYFLQTFWSVIIPEDPVYNWHIEYLCDELQKLSVNIFARLPKLYDMIINVPPGSTKSTIVTVMWPAWLWTNDPRLRVISNSYSGDLSTEHASFSKDIITSELYKKLFPEVEIRHDKSGKSAYGNTKGGSRITTSTQGTITGKHGHVIINDDPVNPKQAASDALRLEANKHTGTLSSRKVDKKVAVSVTIMQRLHNEDVTGYLLKKKGEHIHHICLPAEISDRVMPTSLKDKYVDGLLDPIRIDRIVLAEAKIDLGAKGYANQFEQAPTPDGGNIIKKEWFGKISIERFLSIMGSRAVMHFYLDTAFSEKNTKTDNDPSGILAACHLEGYLYIFNAMKMWKEFPELIAFLPEYILSHKGSDKSKLNIEPKANGKSVVQTLKKISSLNVKETPSPTDDKTTRLNVAAPKIECGRVILVEGLWNEEFVEEVCGFPAAKHDEYVDNLCYAVDDLLTNYKEIPTGQTKASLGFM